MRRKSSFKNPVKSQLIIANNRCVSATKMLTPDNGATLYLLEDRRCNKHRATCNMRIR